MAAAKFDVEVEAHAEAHGDDIANVRKLPADGPAVLSSVEVMPSDAPLAAVEIFEQLMAIRRTMRGEDGGGSVDKKSQ